MLPGLVRTLPTSSGMYSDVSNSDVPLDKRYEFDDKLDIRDLINEKAEFISISNMNNLSEVYIYKNNHYNHDVDQKGIWDGKSYTTEWYNKDPEADVFIIDSASDLAGFSKLVSDGVTFKDKEIRLDNNIDLNGHEWTPIGKPYRIVEDKTDENHPDYDVILDEAHTFQGIFDGKNHTIYGLSIREKKYSTMFYGFFLSLYHAQINNVIFDRVEMNNSKDNIGYATVAGIAIESIFSQIKVFGNITAAKLAGICIIAVDSCFYICDNYVHLNSSPEPLSGIVVGGICGQLTVTEKATSMTNENDAELPTLFFGCRNHCDINIDASNAQSIWAGHIFGGTFYNIKHGEYGFTLDCCSFKEDVLINVVNASSVKGEVVFYGDLNGKTSGNTVINDCKDDLLLGLIGRVSETVAVKVIKITRSTRTGYLVLNGSINVLFSDAGENTFQTVDVLSRTDNINSAFNLEPYFTRIKIDKR